MKKFLSILLTLCLLLSLSSSALALNYAQRLVNDVTFETLEEARMNGPLYLSQATGRQYISDPALDTYPEGTTYIYRSKNLYSPLSAAFRMNTNLLVYTDATFQSKDEAFAYLKNLGVIALADEAVGSVVLVTPIDPAKGFGAADQLAYYQLQSAMCNLGFSVKVDGVSNYYADNTYYGGLTYRYLIALGGGATFINDYVSPVLDYVSRIAGMLLVGGAMEDIRDVSMPVPVYLVGAPANVIEKYKLANDVDAYGYVADVETFYNQQQPLQCVKVQAAADVAAEFVDGVYHDFFLKAMRIPAVKESLYTPATPYSNYNMNQTPYSLCVRNAIVNGVTADGIYVTEHHEDRFKHIIAENGEYLDTWYEFLPEAVVNGTAPVDSVPLWLSNHGGGDDPIQFVDEIGLLELAGKEQFAIVGAAYQSLYSSTPVLADSLAALVEYMLETYPALDESRVYTTGYSMGGGTTVTVMVSHPELFAAAAPMAASGSFIGSEEQVQKLEELGMAYMAMTSTYDVVGYKNFNLASGIQAALNRFCNYNELKEIEYDFATYPLSGFKGDAYERTLLNNEYVNHVWYVCNEDGVPFVALNLTEDLKHSLYPEYGKLAWEYVRQFSRDQETGKLCYDPYAN